MSTSEQGKATYQCPVTHLRHLPYCLTVHTLRLSQQVPNLWYIMDAIPVSVNLVTTCLPLAQLVHPSEFPYYLSLCLWFI